jgi:UDPglucose 6-dehydrogenase
MNSIKGTESLQSEMQITVIGSGYVGLVAAVGLCELGHRVICVDNDTVRVEKLRSGIVPIHEQHVPELLQKHLCDRLTFSCELAPAVSGSAVVFIAVGTPAGENGEADLSYVERVARELARAVTKYTVIVEKSTVPVYTSNWIRRAMLLDGASPDLFDVVSNPEFLREGNAVVDFLYPDRIVIGGDNERAIKVIRKVYRGLEDGSYYASAHAVRGPGEFPGKATVLTTSTTSAELIKHASNAFLALKISFINAVANVCESVGADISEVACGIGSDQRIGPRFLSAGIGYGGSCFPKDLKAFRVVASQAGCDFRLLDDVATINAEQQKRFINKVKGALWNLRGKRVAVLGLAFKGGTDDIRESPAVAIVTRLLEEGCFVTAYDPAAMEKVRSELAVTACVTYAADAYEALKGVEAALFLTDWEEFAELDLRRMKTLMRQPIVIDGRNLFNPAKMADLGFVYLSVGRASILPRDFPRESKRTGTFASMLGV